jgi:uncharacterized iron-regulated protein
MVVRSLCLAFLIACAGTAKPQTTPAKRGIEAAGLPYSIVDARTGRQVETRVFWDQLAGSRVICVGEEHNNPHHHWVQLEVVTQLTARNKQSLALGMEMFQRPFQGVLDDYAARRIDEATLRSRSGYEERWSYDFGFYRPTMERARAAGATLLALNAAKELTKAVVRRGVEGLTPEEKQQLPELNLDDAGHRAWFMSVMEDMGAHGGAAHPPPSKEPRPAAAPSEAGSASAANDKPPMPSMDRIYTAQVVWDETMADGAARWAKAQPSGLLVLLAGNGHCHDSAIVGRVRRRGVDNVISIRPVIDVEGQVAAALAKPMNDFLVVLQMPR